MDEFISNHADKYQLAKNQSDSNKKQMYVKFSTLLIDKRLKVDYVSSAQQSSPELKRFGR